MPTAQTIDTLNLIGKSDRMQQLYKMIGRVCNADCAILLIGEKGSGKKLVARAIHYFSHRASAPFLTLHGREATPSSDEELLGIDASHQTDATCYITELTSMPYFVHGRLLAIHRRKEYKCNHQTRSRKHNLRFIVGTEENMKEELQNGAMPSDFFYDWNFLPLFIPPLRDRKEDIPLLADYFLKSLAAEMKFSQKELAPEAVELLMSYDWPGNIDELKSALAGALSRCRGNYLRPEHFGALKSPSEESVEAFTRLEMFLNSKLSAYIESFSGIPDGDLYRLILPQMEKSLFDYALRKSRGNKNRAAEILGLHRNTLNKKLQRFSI